VKRQWNEQELGEHWSLSHGDYELLRHRTGHSRIGFAVVLKFFTIEGRFPKDRNEVPNVALEYIADQVSVSPDNFREYSLTGRSSERDRSQIRELLGFQPATVEHHDQLREWLTAEVLPLEHKREHILESALEWCRKTSIERTFRT